MRALLIASGLLAATLSTAAAAPVTLDFEDLVPTSTGGGRDFYGQTIVEDGFILTTDAVFGGFASATPTGVGYTGSTAVFGNTVGATTVLAQQNSDPFSITSMAVTFTNGVINALAEFDLTFLGVKANSAIVQQTFTIGPGFNPSLQPLNFSSAFSGLASLSWTHPSQTFQFDNVVVDGAAPVPAPAAMALFGFGLLSLMARRKTS